MKKNHLPLFGVGPVYAIVIVLVTVLAVVLKSSLPSVMPPRTIQIIMKLIGFFLLVLAGCIWVMAAVVSKIDEHILKNELVTDGIYAWVRNPLYAAFLLGCTGILLIEGNLLLLPLPILYWAFLTVLMQHTEEKWLLARYGETYRAYCRRVNRCIPWFPKRSGKVEKQEGRCISVRRDRKTRAAMLLCGMLGCLCFGTGDWLMMFGDPASDAALSWLTEGVRTMAGWRLNLAMVLAFPGIVLYGIGLFGMENYIPREKPRRAYHYLNIFGMTPWIALHLFYVMILTLWTVSGDSALCVQLYDRLKWMIPLSMAVMLPVFVWWAVIQGVGSTVFPRGMAAANVIVIYLLLKGISLCMPVSAFRMGFTNALMSESMMIWFGIALVWDLRRLS